MQSTNQAGLDIIESFEGFRSDWYKDLNGFDTIGYGHKKRAGDINLSLPLSKSDAERLLNEDIDIAESIIRASVTVPLTDNQFSALVSFVYNVGDIQFESSTLLKELNTGNYSDVPAQLKRWVYTHKIQQNGLVRRRNAEASLFSLQE